MSLYRALEKGRAGFGAAGLVALLAEALAAKYLAPFTNEGRIVSYLIIGIIALGAFLLAASIVDISEDPPNHTR